MDKAENTTSKNKSNEGLYVVACIFNPAGFQTRYDLYYNFEKHITSSNVNLVTIECAFGKREFQVTKEDNPNHIQVRSEDPIWVKENLINIAISRLPKDWKYVLWLDSDIEFTDQNWPEKIVESFTKYEVIQVFKYANFLGPNQEVLETHFSLLYSLVHDLPISKPHYNIFYPHPGYGWGITRSAYERIGKLLDFGIVGSGDSHMAFSFIGRPLESNVMDKSNFHENYLKAICDWSEKVKYLFEEKRLGYADVNINHFFHGYREDRQYVLRMKILTDFKFDPFNDMFENEMGVIELKENRRDLKDAIYSYFVNRKEDNKNKVEFDSMKIPFKTPEEVLDAANFLKRYLNQENFKKMQKSLRKNGFKENLSKRSRSTETKRRNPDRNNRASPRGKKVIEMYYEINLGIDNSSKGSTDNSHASDSEDSEYLPDKNQRKASVDDSKLVTKYGTCCSKTDAKEDSNNSQGQNHNPPSNYNNPNVNVNSYGQNNLNNAGNNQAYGNPSPGFQTNNQVNNILRVQEEQKKKENDKKKQQYKGSSYGKSSNQKSSYYNNNYY